MACCGGCGMDSCVPCFSTLLALRWGSGLVPGEETNHCCSVVCQALPYRRWHVNTPTRYSRASVNVIDGFCEVKRRIRKPVLPQAHWGKQVKFLWHLVNDTKRNVIVQGPTVLNRIENWPSEWVTGKVGTQLMREEAWIPLPVYQIPNSSPSHLTAPGIAMGLCSKQKFPS